MVLERFLVRTWNNSCRIMGWGRPIYNYPVKANFMGLSENTANVINSFYMARLPLKGTNIQVDVLNNRRHQIIGVFLPATILIVCGVQFGMYNLTRAPKVKSQTPAPGWEVPSGYDWEHLPATPANIAMWRKRHEMGSLGWDYRGGEAHDIMIGTHPWYHGQDSHLPHEQHFEDVDADIDEIEGGHGKGHGHH